MSKKIGIKTDDGNRLLAIGELITGDLEGLVAYLGDGFFVVTEEVVGELTERGIEFMEVEIVKGSPKCEICEKQYKRILPTIPPVPDCDCEKPQSSEQIMKEAEY